MPPKDSQKSMLKFLVCGSVDDGKSTLIGRLLYDCGQISDDILEATQSASAIHGTTGGGLDLALLVDGLEDERAQGITIDICHRYFSTAKRAFAVIDAPGHEQYTRNMVTGASLADAAIILVDAAKGLSRQTFRHAMICDLMGIKKIVLAVNKMDLVKFDQQRFNELTEKFERFVKGLKFQSWQAIPMSAREGIAVTTRGAELSWYHGPTLLTWLEEVDLASQSGAMPLRLPIQLVNRPNSEFRGYCGTIGEGQVRIGDSVKVVRSGLNATITKILVGDRSVDMADPGTAVCVTLDTELDISRGDMLCSPDAAPDYVNQFSATLVWLWDQALLPGRTYMLRTGTDWVPASITSVRHLIDVETHTQLAGRHLSVNDIGVCHLVTQRPIAVQAYTASKTAGAFILVDRLSAQTVAAGLINHSLRRSQNLGWTTSKVTAEQRQAVLAQKPIVVWFTGLSGSGKSTLATQLEARLMMLGKSAFVLDGDNLRQGLNQDLGFTDADRVENIRRVGEVAKLFTDAGLITLCSFISPFEADRQKVRETVGPDRFLEIFVDAPIETCIQRDPKGLYKRALAGDIPGFTGISQPYEAPQNPDLRLDTATLSVEECVEAIYQLILAKQ